MFAFRYTFDGGPEKILRCPNSEYRAAALAAFGRERIERVPTAQQALVPYDGHVLKLWVKDFPPEYGPYLYGLRENEFLELTIIPLTA